MKKPSTIKACFAILIAFVCLTACSQPEIPMHIEDVSIVYNIESGEVALSTQTEGAEIYYTLDGTTPDTASMKYDSPFYIDSSAYIMAVAYKDGTFSNVKSLYAEYENDESGPDVIGAKIEFDYDEETKEISIFANQDGCEIYYGFEAWDIESEYNGAFVPPAGVTVYAKSKKDGVYSDMFSYKVPMWAELYFSYDAGSGLLEIACTDPRLDIRYAIDSSEMYEALNENGPSFSSYNLYLYKSASDIYQEPIALSKSEGILVNLNYDEGGWLLEEDILYTIPLEVELEIVYTEDGYFEIVDHNEETRDSEDVHIYYTLSGDNPIKENSDRWWNIRYYEKGSRILVGPGVEIKAAARTYHSITDVETLRTDGPYVVGGKGELGIIFYDVDEDNDSGNEDGLVSSDCGFRYFEATLGDVRVYEEENGKRGFTHDVYSALYKDRCMAYSSNSPAGQNIAYEYFKTPHDFSFANGTLENNDSVIGTRKEFGSGRENTELMLAFAEDGIGYYADEWGEAFEYGVLSALKSFNEEDGWFIPSYEEAKAMYDTFLTLGVGNIYITLHPIDPAVPDVLEPVYYEYWTSSEFFDTDDYDYVLIGGTQKLENHKLVHTYPEYSDSQKYYNKRANRNMLKLVRTF